MLAMLRVSVKGYESNANKWPAHSGAGQILDTSWFTSFGPLHLPWFLMVEFLGQETDIREVIYKVFWGAFECKQLS